MREVALSTGKKNFFTFGEITTGEEGWQFFRQLSGKGQDFTISAFTPGMIAFRATSTRKEVMVVANTAEQDVFRGEVIVDADLNQADGTFSVLFSLSPEPLCRAGCTQRLDPRARRVDQQ